MGQPTWYPEYLIPASFSGIALKGVEILFVSATQLYQNHTNTQAPEVQGNLQYAIFVPNMFYKKIQMCCAYDI